MFGFHDYILLRKDETVMTPIRKRPRPGIAKRSQGRGQREKWGKDKETAWSMSRGSLLG